MCSLSHGENMKTVTISDELYEHILRNIEGKIFVDEDMLNYVQGNEARTAIWKRESDLHKQWLKEMTG
jgi:predicted CopG family antitoxin